MTLPSGPTLFFETTAQRTAYSSTALSEGQLCYDQQTNSYYGWDGSAWTGISFDDVVIADDLTVGDDITLASGSVITWASDTNLYRSAADTLATDDAFRNASSRSTSYVEANMSGAGWTASTNSVALGWDGAQTAAAISFGSTYDTNLYRSSANTLATDDDFIVANGKQVGVKGTDLNVGIKYDSTTDGIQVKGSSHGGRWMAGSTEKLRIFNSVLDLGSDMVIQWGTAFGTNDTNLYRSAANTLKTDDTLVVLGDVDVHQADNRVAIGAQGPSSQAGFNFGSGGGLDTNLYRSAANTLKTDDDFKVGESARITASAGQITLGDPTDPGGGGLLIGTSTDRLRFVVTGGVEYIQTDDLLHFGPIASTNLRLSLSTTGVLTFGDGASTTADTNLYRSAANQLRTDDLFIAGGGLTMGGVITMYDNGGTITFFENGTTEPSAPAANGVTLFVKDNGAGKSVLMALFASGASQQIAIQP